METVKHKFQKIKNIYHFGQAILANFVYGRPARRIKVIGVTGTNGKTTTVWMIGKILEEAGFKVAINSTINFQIGEKKWVNKTKFTTLSSFAVQKFIKEAVKEGCDYLILEVSSHSLDQFRVGGISYAVAVITNITREHLDYHETMKKYRKAKLKLFKKSEVAVVNLDMEGPEEFLSCNSKLKFGFTTKISNSPNYLISNNPPAGEPNPNDQIKKIIAENIELGIDYSSYKLKAISHKLNLLGKFNIENALAATSVGLSQGISLEIISKALEKIQGIPGRMEYVPNNKGFNIIIDYAVTPDSLEKLYDLINQIRCHSHGSGNLENKDWVPNQVRDGNNFIIAVFGACGERDRGKRPMMGGIIAKYADYIIITNEDPYGEDPNQIINEVFGGVVKNPLPDFASVQSTLSLRERGLGGEGKMMAEGVNVWRILDRREAIKKALHLAHPGDFVIITGKGAEEIMAIGKKRIPWKEREIIEEELSKM